MEIIERLKDTYGTDVPIFIDEIKMVMKEYSTPYIFKCIKSAISEGKLIRFDESVYYIPTETIFGESALNPYDVIEKKYMVNEESISGFYSGWTLLNAIGGTRQVPNVVEVVTNRETMNVREITLGNQKIILRKPKLTITDNNEKILQILELANQFKLDEEATTAVIDYAKSNQVTAKDLLKYAEYYPAKTMKNLRGVLYELT